MAQYEEWNVEPADRGWLSRFIAPQANARPATVAFVLAAVGLATFVASLALDWTTLQVTPENGEVRSFSIKSNAASVAELGLVYVLGMVAMFGFLGAVLPRPDLALRFRLVAAGVSLALLGVVVAATLRVRDDTPVLWGPVDTSAAYEPGAICALVAVVLPLAAVWFAARPAVREARFEAERAERPAVAPAPRMAAPFAGRPGITVAAAEPHDLSVTPDR